MKTSEQIDKIAPAILEAQKETTNPKRTSVNPFYNSTYAPLTEVLEIRAVYNKHGMSILQDINSEGCVSTMILHESGQWIQQDGMKLPLDKQTAQGAGSSVTYGRRYTLEAMTGTASEEDDDGNGNETEKPGTKKTAPSQDEYFLDNENAPTREAYAGWKAAGIQNSFGKWVKDDAGKWNWYSIKDEAGKRL